MHTGSTPITVVTLPTGGTSPIPSEKTSPGPPTPKASGPPVRLLDVAQTQRQRLAKSLNENELVVLTGAYNQKSNLNSSTVSPRTHRNARNLAVPQSGSSSSTSTTPTASIRGGSPRTPMRHRILFCNRNDPHHGFTNSSAHPVVYKGKKYPTSEHLFQSFKFQEHRPNLAEHIRTCSESPSVAFSQARRFQPEVRPDWSKVNIQKMDETLWHKFTQHADLKEELLSTGDAELVEDSDKDAFWGVGSDRRGRNELGKALERLRTRLREA